MFRLKKLQNWNMYPKSGGPCVDKMLVNISQAVNIFSYSQQRNLQARPLFYNKKNIR